MSNSQWETEVSLRITIEIGASCHSRPYLGPSGALRDRSSEDAMNERYSVLSHPDAAQCPRTGKGEPGSRFEYVATAIDLRRDNARRSRNRVQVCRPSKNPSKQPHPMSSIEDQDEHNAQIRELY